VIRAGRAGGAPYAGGHAIDAFDVRPIHRQRPDDSTVRKLITLLVASMLACGSLTSPAVAASFSTKKFVYRANNKKLADVLQDFAASQSLPIVIDPGVDGTVNADFNAKPEDFLNAMTRTYGVIWYHDGTTLFVYPASAMQSRVFRMRGYDREQVRQMFASLGLGDARFPLRFDDSQQTLLASGPPRHIELVSTVVEQLERDSRDRVGKAIRVFPLRFASAADRVIGSSRIPGLASTLNTLFSAEAQGAGGTADQAAAQAVDSAIGKVEKQRAMEQTYGVKPQSSAGVAGTPFAALVGAGGNPHPPTIAADSNAAASDAERPYFQADEASNAIIVRGLPDRMKEYETLIHQLDAPQDLVEIEATIIDVNNDAFDSLGIDWNFTNGTTSIAVSPGSPAQGVGGMVSNVLTGANITTVIGNAGYQLLTRVRALEGNGKARILARPKVLGVVNRTASMVDKRVASVRVAGNLDANLFTVEAGTVLQVTPQLVPYGDHREVRLTLSIQDGNFEGQTVDAVPIVKRTEINTEATIREGESLLVGGISIESDTTGRTGIPGLSKIPVVGAAFRHDETGTQRSERLFLITPKIVSVGTPVAGAPATTPLASAPARATAVANATPVPAPVPAPTPAPALAAPTPVPAPVATAAPAPASAAAFVPPATAAPAVPAAPAAAAASAVASPDRTPATDPAHALALATTATTAASLSNRRTPAPLPAALATPTPAPASAPAGGCAAQAFGLAATCDTSRGH